MKSGKLQKFNVATITISDNAARHNRPVYSHGTWMNETVYLAFLIEERYNF